LLWICELYCLLFCHLLLLTVFVQYLYFNLCLYFFSLSSTGAAILFNKLCITANPQVHSQQAIQQIKQMELDRRCRPIPDTAEHSIVFARRRQCTSGTSTWVSVGRTHARECAAQKTAWMTHGLLQWYSSEMYGYGISMDMADGRTDGVINRAPRCTVYKRQINGNQSHGHGHYFITSESLPTPQQPETQFHPNQYDFPSAAVQPQTYKDILQSRSGEARIYRLGATDPGAKPLALVRGRSPHEAESNLKTKCMSNAELYLCTDHLMFTGVIFWKLDHSRLGGLSVALGG